jgi:hypothetical protein
MIVLKFFLYLIGVGTPCVLLIIKLLSLRDRGLWNNGKCNCGRKMYLTDYKDGAEMNFTLAKCTRCRHAAELFFAYTDKGKHRFPQLDLY